MKNIFLFFLSLLAIFSYSANNVITYTSNSRWKLSSAKDDQLPGLHEYAFNAKITQHTFTDGVGKLVFDADVTTIGAYAFNGCEITSIDLPQTVTTIKKYAFEQCSLLVSINVPETVTSIEERAFLQCASLSSFAIPQGITCINEAVFDGCESITSITIPDGVTSIGDNAFYGTGLLSVTIPENVTSLGSGAFGSCTRLKSITIPNRVSKIDNNAFRNCYELTSVVIGDSVRSIRDNAFKNCSKIKQVRWNAIDCWVRIEGAIYDNTPCLFPEDLQELTFGDKVQYIPQLACKNFRLITCFTIPSSVKRIDVGTFAGCPHLTSFQVEAGNGYFSTKEGVLFNLDQSILLQYPTGLRQTEYVIPSSVTSINEKAFYHCTYLQSVYVPQNIVYSLSAFRDCGSLSNINVDANNKWLSSKDGIVFNKAGNSLYLYPNGKTYTKYTIPKGVVTIDDYAFYKTSLDTIVIPKHVTSINEYAFNSSNLTTVIIQDGVKRIKKYAFGNCKNLHTVFLGDSIRDLEDGAFGSCKNLRNVTIGDSLKTIGANAFYFCSGLTSLTLPDGVTSIGDYGLYQIRNVNYSGNAAGSPWGAKCINGYTDEYMVYSDEGRTNLVRCSSAATGDIVIPSTVKTIEAKAFEDCNQIVSITIPKGVTEIPESAFNSCTSLSIVTFLGEITHIGSKAFYNCKSLYDISIPSSVSKIDSYAFQFCSGITSLTINKNIGSVGLSAFSYVNNVEYKGGLTTKNWDAKCINGYVEGDLVYNNSDKTKFCGCSSAKQGMVKIANTVTEIGAYAFVNCSKVTSILLPNQLKTIGKYAFQGCGIKSLDMPENVTTIGEQIISLCKDIQSISCCNTTPPTCDKNSFYDLDFFVPLYVKPGSINDYKTASCWKKFFTISYIHRGVCGDSLNWNYEDGTLYIDGVGSMYDYSKNTMPWLVFRDSIISMVINNGATTIGQCAFYGLKNKNIKSVELPVSITLVGDSAFADCTWLKSVTFGANTESIGANAFANDQKLLYVKCFAMEPPTLSTNGFANWDAYLSVPCEVKDDYKVSVGWKLFNKDNVSCIGAEETPTTSVYVVPSSNSVEITWPKNDQATDYTIEIKKEDLVFCTLTFNAQGQLTNITFAPERGSSNNIAMAEAVNGGYKFTVTSLTPGTTYNYEVDTKNAAGISIANYTGQFTTTGTSTSLDQLTDSPTDRFTKINKDGHLLILRDGKTYNAQGAITTMSN